MIAKATLDRVAGLFGGDTSRLPDSDLDALLQGIEFEQARFGRELKRRRRDWQAQTRQWSHFAAEHRRGLGHRRNCTFMTDWLGDAELLLAPRLKLAFCHMPQVGAAEFKGLFRKLSESGAEPAGSWRGALPPGARSRGWRFAAFTRDPLERYAGTFASTCVEAPEGGAQRALSCCGGVLTKKATEQDLVEHFGHRAGLDLLQGLPSEEANWAPQVQLLFNCGWEYFGPQRLDFRGDLSAGGVSAQVKDMLRLSGAAEDDLQLADRFFPDGGAVDASPIALTPDQFYSSRSVVESVKAVYEADYALLPGVGRHFTARTEARVRAGES